MPMRTGTGLRVVADCPAAAAPAANPGAAPAASAACLTKSRLVTILALLPPEDAVPALAVGRPADERRRLGSVRRPQVLVVPLELLPRPVSDVAKMIRFGRPAGILEVRAGDRAVALGVV